MRLIWFFALGLLLAHSSCTKDLPKVHDSRDEIIGTYKGISVHTYWSGTGTIFNNDTTEAEVILSKGDSLTLVEVTLAPKVSNERCIFIYNDGVFKTTRMTWPQTMEVTSGKLYFFHVWSNGPHRMEYFAQKTL